MCHKVIGLLYLFKIHQCIGTISLLSTFGKERGPPFQQT